MIRTLFIISVAGFLLAVACISGAVAIGGRDIANGNWRPDFGNWNWDDEPQVVISSSTYDDPTWTGPEETREIVWEGASQIDIGMPADVTYIQGPTPKITVTGPKGVVERFHADEGDLRLRGWDASNTFEDARPGDTGVGGDRPRRLKITVVAPGVTRFDLSGTETLTIESFSQDTLDIDASGEARVSVKGSVRLLKLDLNGGAHADLAGLTLQRVKADLSGASEATMAPKVSADLDLTGASRVRLLSRPDQLIRDVSGGASIEEISDGKTAEKTKDKDK